MIPTVSVLSPIQQNFNPHLLLYGTVEYYNVCVLKPIQLLGSRKIRDQDTGKRKEFYKLISRFQELYERQKIKEANYKAKVTELAEKMPRLPTSGGIMRFRKFQPKE